MEDIIKHLQVHKSLDGLKLDRKSDKYDLTKLSLPKLTIVDQFIYKNYSIKIPEKIVKFNDVRVQDVDLSYSNLDHSIWYNCIFDNVLLKKVSGRNISLIGCSFNNVIFENAIMCDSLLGGRHDKGDNSGNFNNVKFVKTNLWRTYYSFPKFKGCEFLNCNLKEVDFGGSRFFDSKFEGKLDSVFFRGFPRKHLIDDIIFSRENYNPMEKIDFSKAKMFGVSFTNQINLSSCIFPDSDAYIFIKHFPLTYHIAKNTIDFKWKGKEKETALFLIDNIYLSNEKIENKNDFIDKSIIAKIFKIQGFADRLFSLLREIEEELNNKN